MIAYAGDWERGWPWWNAPGNSIPIIPAGTGSPHFGDAYRKQDYRGALEVALKINMPGDFYVPAVIAAAYGQLGERKQRALPCGSCSR